MTTLADGHPGPAAAPPHELTAEQLRFYVTITPTFQTTAELESQSEFTGQERARAALELGVDLTSRGFNIFVSGLSGTEKLATLHTWVTQRVAQLPTPGDWVYVHNFAYPDAPRAIPLASGKGRRLKFLMTALIKALQEELPKAFRQEAFDKEKAQLKEKYTKMAQALAEEVETHAHEQGFHIQAGSHGQFILIPLVNGKLLDPDEFAKLGETKRQLIAQHQQKVVEELDVFVDRQQELLHNLTEDIRQIEKRFCETLLTPFLTKISHEMQSASVDAYLAEIKSHIIENLDDFKEPQRAEVPTPFLPFCPQSLRHSERRRKIR